MQLNGALSGVIHLGFDTSPFIYFVERHPRYVDIMRDLIRRVDTGQLTGVSSVVTLTEVLTLPKRTGQQAIENAYRTILTQSRHFMLLHIDVDIAEHAAALRAQYTLRTPDALQIAAALHGGCQAFVTNDAALKRVTDLRILCLDELEP